METQPYSPHPPPSCHPFPPENSCAHCVARDLMPTAMADILGESHQDSLLRSRHLWVTAGFLIAAPLAFSRTLGALK